MARQWGPLSKNLIQGVTSDRFAPDRPAQRAEVVTLLYRMAGEPAVTGASGFVDVPADAWYASAVRWAEEKGIAQGVGASYFAPTQAVTRQEMAVFLYRYGQEAGYDVSGQASLSRYADRGPWRPGPRKRSNGPWQRVSCRARPRTPWPPTRWRTGPKWR